MKVKALFGVYLYLLKKKYKYNKTKNSPYGEENK
jgi:hypothetical protein